ncbi:uncharacterized protein LOC141702333 [Apium graveolens]|uniref:uncharacterized protein LOC141702333 n=1 Tax=Apium graveolens TaxID=4045 RepID=UPI003D7B1E9E
MNVRQDTYQIVGYIGNCRDQHLDGVPCSYNDGDQRERQRESSWVLDNGYGSHICINMQELQESRILVKGEVDLRVGNRVKIATLAVGTYHLSLPTGLILELNNCFYVPAIFKNINSVFYLDKQELLYKKNSGRTIDLDEDVPALET